MTRQSEVTLPDLKFKKGVLKNGIKKATYSFCYMCKDKFNCTDETKANNHCLNRSIALEINKVIDFAYDSIREQKKKGEN